MSSSPRAAALPSAALLLLLLLPAARGQGREPGAGELETPPSPAQPGDLPPPPSQPPPQESRLDEWVTLEGARAPEPPLLRAHVALVGWIECRTRVRSDDGGVAGSELDDLEKNQGLDSGGVAPWIELSLGRAVRGGVDASWFARGGELTRQETQVVFDGGVIAQPGGYLRPEFELLTLGAFVEWDFLADQSYRIGLVGGVRYFRFDLRLTGLVDPSSTTFTRTESRGALTSPFFGGLVELTPFDYLSVLARIEFMNWSWDDVELREAHYFALRLGAAVHPVPGTLSIGLEFRYSSVRAEGRDPEGEARVDGAVSSAGAALTLNLSF